MEGAAHAPGRGGAGAGPGRGLGVEAVVHGQDVEGAAAGARPVRSHPGQGQGVASARQGHGEGRARPGVEAGVQTPRDPCGEIVGQAAQLDWTATAAARLRVPSGAAG